MTETFKEECLPDMLPLYYRRIFPVEAFYRWLSYGNANKFTKREISFTLIGDVYIRYQSFVSCEQFIETLAKRFPIKIDIGAIYSTFPSNKTPLQSLKPVEKEIVFDIDLTDYNDVRTCCSGADICAKCWKFMAIACKILDAALKEDFGFKHLLWVFSGRRGIHCWVSDHDARYLDGSVRGAIAEYLQVVRGHEQQLKKVKTLYEIHPSIKRALKIIDSYFVNDIVEAQDIFGTDERLGKFLEIIDKSVRQKIKDEMTKFETSKKRWEAFENCFKRLLAKNEVPRSSKNFIEEIKLQYAYPRLDINVTTGMTHLLKAPYCVHPKTGKIAVPFNSLLVDKFDPTTVPTITQLIDEINAYDAHTKQLMDDKGTPSKKQKVYDYQKTNLSKFVMPFLDFLDQLRRATQNEKAKQANAMEF